MNLTRQFLPRFRGASPKFNKFGMLVIRLLLALAVFMPMTSSRAFSPQEDAAALPTWIKYKVDAPPYFENMTDRSLAIHPYSGAPCIAYGGDALYYSCLNPTTGAWSMTEVDSDVQVGQYTALDFNSFGWPFITYYDAHNARLKLAYNDGVVWRKEVVPNVDGFNAVQTGPQATPAGNPLQDGTGLIPPPSVSVESVPNTGEVVEEQPVAEPPVQPTIESTGQPADDGTEQTPEVQPAEQPTAIPTETPAIQPDDEPTTMERIQQVLKPWLSEAGLAPDFPFESIGYGKHSSIAIDRRDGVHISYHDEIDGSMEYIYWDGQTWWGVVVDDYADQGDVGLWSSIAVDYNYNVYLAYMSEKFDDLKFAFHPASNPPNTGWRKTTVDGIETQINMGSFSSIALEQDLTGDNEKTFTPHISYYDFTHDTLRHAWRRYNSGSNTYTWMTEVVDNGGSSGNVGWYTSIAVDGNDVVHISYFDVGRGNLKYARKSGSSWTLSTLDSTGTSLTGLFTSIAIDSLQRPCISYLHGNTGTLRFIRRVSGNDWVKYTVRTMGHDVGLSTSLAIDTFGIAHVSYHDATAGIMKYAVSAGSNWNLTTFGLPYSGQFSSIDTYRGFPRIAYNEQGQQELMYTAFGVNGWTYSPVDTTFKVGQYVSMELDSYPRPHMSYYDATHKELLYATISPITTKWITTTVDIEGSDVGWYSSLALDQSDKPFISYYDNSNGSFKLIYRSSIGTWIPNTIESIGRLPEEGVGAYTSIDIDRNGNPHISYYDITNKRLKYAYWNGVWGVFGNWNISVLDNSSLDVGRFSSLVIDQTNDTRHICYYDYTNGNLKYAQWTTGGGWQFQVVDGVAGADGDLIDEGDVGLFCSIDLSPTGQPAISYYDNSHGDLKVATSYVFPLAPYRSFIPFSPR